MSTVTTTNTASCQYSIVEADNSKIPHGLGLLTTVASLPPKYRSRYLNLKAKYETPLDLSVKPYSLVPPIIEEIANDVPMATTFTEVYTEPSADEPVVNDSSEISLVPILTDVYTVQDNSPLSEQKAIVTITQVARPITSSPIPTKRKRSIKLDDVIEKRENEFVELSNTELICENPAKLAKSVTNLLTRCDCTPSKPIKSSEIAPKTIKVHPLSTKSTKTKATRKLKFDEETSSPVSGTIIRPLEDITDGNKQYSNGDIDPKYNIVEITDETKAELAAIKNVIGDYICKLCRIKFEDAFGLARHRCACIVLLEYRCPECGKQFNCPANLASHRRWHKPKKITGKGSISENFRSRKENHNITNNASTIQIISKQMGKATDLPYTCEICGKCFKRATYLRKHQQTHNRKRTMNTSASLIAIQKTSTLVADGGFSTASTVVIGRSYPSTSSASSLHSYNDTNEEDHIFYETANDDFIGYGDDIKSTSSIISMGCGRLKIAESRLTEEENIAAAALTNLRNCASVIQHTTLAH